MDNLLALAKDFETKSKEQASNTETALQSAFSRHRQFVDEELKSSRLKISAAITDHEKDLAALMAQNRGNALKMAGRLWLIITVTTVLLTGTCGSVLWYQGYRITEKQKEIDRQNAALAAIKKRTWGVTYYEDSNGKFVVLPAGTTADTSSPWSVLGQPAIRLKQE